jgi:flagellar motor switch protein FliG
VAQISNRRKAALALVAMGPERAAETVRALPEPIVIELLAEVNAIGPVDATTAKKILSEMADRVQVRTNVGKGGPEYTNELLRRALGDRASDLAKNIADRSHRPFAYFEHADPDDVARIISGESPSTVALVIAHLDSLTGAAIFSRLDPDVQADVGLRLAQLETIHRSVVVQVDESLRARLAPLLSQPTTVVPGLELLVDVVNNSSSDVEKSLLVSMAERDAEMALKVREALFVFDDIGRLDDRSIQETLKSIDTRVLAVALKDAPDELGERFFKNLSERARSNLQEEIEYLTGVKAADIKDARKQVVAIIRQLEDEGIIAIERSGDE